MQMDGYATSEGMCRYTTKILHAKPMSWRKYRMFHGMGLRAGENGSKEGYFTFNKRSGRIAWVSKDAFEDMYKGIDDSVD